MPLGHFLYFVEADKPYCNLNGKKNRVKKQKVTFLKSIYTQKLSSFLRIHFCISPVYTV